jgi:hypothetical protein
MKLSGAAGYRQSAIGAEGFLVAPHDAKSSCQSNIDTPQ